MSTTCPEEMLQDLLERGSRNEIDLLQEVIRLLVPYPDDPRLHFLQGSLLAAERQFESARSAMERALEIDPGFAVARFQLGFLLFTSGDDATGREIWKPLLERPPDDALRLFVEGLQKLAVDDFSEAAALLRRGISNNKDNPPMNGDMQKILGEIERMELSAERDEEPMTQTQLALRQAEARKKRLN